MVNLVVSLDTAQKLKAAGYPQDSYFSWVNYSPASLGLTVRPYPDTPRTKKVAAAPTAQELADQLPTDIELHKTAYVWGATYLLTSASGRTMAEALASLYLRLQEGK